MARPKSANTEENPVRVLLVLEPIGVSGVAKWRHGHFDERLWCVCVCFSWQENGIDANVLDPCGARGSPAAPLGFLLRVGPTRARAAWA